MRENRLRELSKINRRKVLLSLGSSAVGFGAAVGGASAKRNGNANKLVKDKERKTLIDEAYDDLEQSRLGEKLTDAGYGVALAPGKVRTIVREDGTSIESVLLPLTLSPRTHELTSDGELISNGGGPVNYVWQRGQEGYAVRIAEVEQLAPSIEIKPSAEFSMNDSGTEVIRPESHTISISGMEDDVCKEITVSLPSNEVTVDVEEGGWSSSASASLCNPSLPELILEVGGCAAGCGGCGSLAIGNFTWVALAGCIICGGCGCAIACCLGEAASENDCLIIATLYITEPSNLAYACMYEGCYNGC